MAEKEPTFRIRQWFGRPRDSIYAAERECFTAEVCNGKWFKKWEPIGPDRCRREYAEEDIEAFVRERNKRESIKVTTYYNREGQRHG